MGQLDERARLRRLSWYCYDFGNTAIEFVVALYLGQWLIRDRGVSPRLYGALFAVVSFGIVATSTTIGQLLERRSRVGVGVRVSSLLAAVFIASLSLFPAGRGYENVVLCTSAIGLYLFAIAAVLYNSALARTSNNEAMLATSSAGTAASYAGGLAGVGAVALLTSGYVVPEWTGRQSSFLFASVFFLLCSAPALLNHDIWDGADARAIAGGEGTIWRTLARSGGLQRLCLGYGLGNVCIVGMLLYMPMYVHERGYGDTAATWWFLWGAACAGLGAGMNVWLGRRFRAHAILTPAVMLCGIGAALFGVSRDPVAIAGSLGLEAAGAGAFLGAVRAAFAEAIPRSQQASGFGLVAGVQRLSGGVGAMVVPVFMSERLVFGLWPILGCAGAGLASALCLAPGLLRRGEAGDSTDA